MAVVNSFNLIQCEYCGQEFNSYESYITHEQVTHICPECIHLLKGKYEDSCLLKIIGKCEFESKFYYI